MIEKLKSKIFEMSRLNLSPQELHLVNLGKGVQLIPKIIVPHFSTKLFVEITFEITAVGYHVIDTPLFY